jgi:zinc transporter 9
VNLTVNRGHDPIVNVVLLEDFAAVLGVVVAGSCMAASCYWNSPIPDAVGSLLVGGLLGGVASSIIYTNTNALVGRSIPLESIQRINSELESDLMIRAVHDVKGIDMGDELFYMVAELRDESNYVLCT